MTEHCRVALKTSTEWGDWVFDKNTKRMTFEEQFEYYTKNKHLKHISSASEIKDSGIDVSDMFTGVVINLEEVRLDAIQLHKENQNQKNEINELKKLAKQQQKEMQNLKNELEKLKEK